MLKGGRLCLIETLVGPYAESVALNPKAVADSYPAIKKPSARRMIRAA